VSIPQPWLGVDGVTNQRFRLAFQSIAGVIYITEYRNSLTTGTWTELERRFGVGGLETVTNATAGGATRFYRVRALYAPTPILGAFPKRGTDFHFGFTTVTGANYIVHYKTNLNDPVWHELERHASEGFPIMVQDTNAAGPIRFYRVKVE
jgi:hypothetical protein